MTLTILAPPMTLSIFKPSISQSSTLLVRCLSLFGYLLCSSTLVNAAQIAHVTFDVSSGTRYESDILLPSGDNVKNMHTEMEQLIYQSLHSVTMFTEMNTQNRSTVPATKLATYGLTLHSKVINIDQDLYQFSLEYMGQPTLSLSSTETNKLHFKDSPEDIKYQVNFALQPDVPVCNKISKQIGNSESFTSTLCITLK